LVDIGAAPEFYVVPEWWIEDSIYREHQEYLARHGGRRAQNPDSKHHGIPKSRVAEWRPLGSARHLRRSSGAVVTRLLIPARYYGL
jgi:hypothetical protein